ncbi:MAG: hypothetical protein V1679_02155, partial [Candidatus Peregrinibacteria bacterium]
MKSKSLFLVSLVVGAIMLQVFFVGEVFALAIPKYLSYEGYLTDSDDTALTGTYNMTFKLYDALTDGNLEWTEVQSGVTVTNGYFAVQLGDTTALTLAFDEQYFLTITVGSDSEMTPRQPVNAVGYSYASDVAFGSFGASTAPTSPSGGDLYYDTDDGNLYVYDDVLTAWTDMTGGGGGTLQTAYDAGVTIEQDASGPVLITETDDDNTDLLQVTANASTGNVFTADLIQMTMDAVDANGLTGNGLHIVVDVSQNTGYLILAEDDVGADIFYVDETGAILAAGVYGTDLTIASSNLLNLTATSDVVIPVNVGLHFGDGAEKIESNNTDLTINSGGDIDLVPVSDVDVTLPAGGKFFIDAATTDNTGTAGVLDINYDAAASGGSGISLALTAVDDDAVDTLYGIDVAVTVQADTTADDVVYGQRIDLNNQD